MERRKKIYCYIIKIDGLIQFKGVTIKDINFYSSEFDILIEITNRIIDAGKDGVVTMNFYDIESEWNYKKYNISFNRDILIQSRIEVLEAAYNLDTKTYEYLEKPSIKECHQALDYDYNRREHIYI